MLLLVGCASAPPLEWRMNASQAMESFQRLYLDGHAGAAEAEFKRARSEIARTGRADLIARAELVRCAVRAASLEFDPCPGFEALRDLARAEEIAYAEYLLGKGSSRPSEEPLSRLVAAAVQFRAGGISPTAIDAAVETASAQGWRRPLLAWLGVQAKRAEDAGDRETAARIRRRIHLISG